MDRPTGQVIRRYQRSRPGELVHVDIACSEVMTDEHKETAAAFWRRAIAFFANHGITVERVLTDNGSCYRSRLFGQTLSAAGIIHKRTRPYRPQTNGKVERLNRTLLEEWAYVRPYSVNAERSEALKDFLHTYNDHRCHTALEGKPPISRVNNPAGQYS
jgi:transposase InsO family protein